MRKMLVSFFLIVLFSQCSRDRFGEDESCVQLNELTDMLGESLVDFGSMAPGLGCINPKNSDEILLMTRSSIGSKSGRTLLKYNLKTKVKEFIFRGSFINTPKWGSNGWILLTLDETVNHGNFKQNVFKIKSNGDSLTRLTTSGLCYDPEWNLAGDRFVYSVSFTSPKMFIISDVNGIVIDTVYMGVNGPKGSWRHQTFFVNSLLDGLYLGDYAANSYELLYETEIMGDSGSGAAWLDEENVFWCNLTGVYRTNVKSRRTIIIRKTCNALWYTSPTYAKSINKVILSKSEIVKKNDGSGRYIRNKWNVMMNPDGSGEEIIEVE